jgi:hypothetical protein
VRMNGAHHESGGGTLRSSLSSGKMVSNEKSLDRPSISGQEIGSEPKPFRSSLGEAIKHDHEPASAAGVLDIEKPEAGRKKLTETLRERMEARNLGRGKSLADLAKGPSSVEGGPGTRTVHNDIQSPASTEKEARTAAFYARIDHEEAKRESARRAVPFQSSLKAAITTPARPSPAASLAAKIKYSIQELRR